jgi:8-oxo-dGTP pyrophosphatase MutT (NUDIX family)
MTDVRQIRRALGAPRPPADELLLMRNLAGELARPMHPPEGVTPRAAAALILLAPLGDDLRLPLTVRSADLAHHSGEVSLPGGAADPGDADAAATALREAHEELGIEPAAVEVLGALTPIYIPPSNFQLTAVVGYSPELPPFQPNPGEVDAVLLVALRQLMDPANVRVETWERRGAQFRVPFYEVDGYKVWGATALVLSELAARVRRAAIGR